MQVLVTFFTIIFAEALTVLQTKTKDWRFHHYVVAALVAWLVCGGLDLKCLLKLGVTAALAVTLLQRPLAALLAAGSRPRQKCRSPNKSNPLRLLLATCFRRFRSFDERLDERLQSLKYYFSVAVDIQNKSAEGTNRLGVRLARAQGDTCALEVLEVALDGLVHEHNVSAKLSGKMPQLVAGDHIIGVNNQESAPMMLEVMANPGACDTLNLHLARSPTDTSEYVLWEVELDRGRDERWGVNLARLDVGEQVLVQRVLQAGAFWRWNRRPSQRSLRGPGPVCPGDVILACQGRFRAQEIIKALQDHSHVRLTLLRWRPPESITNTQTTLSNTDRAVSGASCESEQASDISHNAMASPDVPAPSCTCCGQACDKFVLVRCRAGDSVQFRRECWRKRHGGFTPKHAPRHCICGDLVERIEVFEHTGLDEPRLVHTILSGLPDQQGVEAQVDRRNPAVSRRRHDQRGVAAALEL
mmetsp:Transcript_80407/g.155366  ORF Transcript_80407/g.155366 Transcript_80407/m.155366 type:complete len:471 (+) Transcript_80407:175-1587(+)